MLLLFQCKDSRSDNKQQSKQGDSDQIESGSVNETIVVKIAL